MILSVCPNPSIDCYAWLEKIRPGEVNRFERLQEFPGGKGVHIAMAIAELGGESCLFGNWAGNSGDWIKKQCSERNIKISGIELDGNNRKCYTLRSLVSKFNNTEFLEPGPEMNNSNWKTFKKKFEINAEKADVICLSGSWPSRAPKDAYFQFIEIAKKQRKRSILDCTGNQLLEALKTPFFGLHLNEEEAFNLCGSNEIRDLLKVLKGQVELIALTKGKEGLWMAYKGKIIKANIKIEKIISTVGSGDCLTAGIARAVEQGLNPLAIASYGVACGAANCLNEDLGILQKQDVEKLLPKVEYKIEEYEY
ncbi:1-phosphofructokinase family hexose kinase [Autumnicola musiva]|uniref:PfkB family carbohydrate kinase n=1 Tax=Autumnicola musiva TaxID=3075589 RepID=A0ABU3DAK3_9FLAO|nr:PfkB family carbohydrate kinase [Zunongwangia sp. F117]MDT0678568.1 PfkB family carbohydrate kinase [Zunongwangia sp. F117]